MAIYQVYVSMLVVANVSMSQLNRWGLPVFTERTLFLISNQQCKSTERKTLESVPKLYTVSQKNTGLHFQR